MPQCCSWSRAMYQWDGSAHAHTHVYAHVHTPVYAHVHTYQNVYTHGCPHVYKPVYTHVDGPFLWAMSIGGLL